MKKAYFNIAFLVSFFAFSSLQAQLALPQASPKASISYTVGLTEISIAYSSPAVKEREVWGNLVPFGEVWRAGANDATTMTFSTDLKIEGKDLKAGTYAFFIIPKDGEEEMWTAIFNTDTEQWGAYNYDESKDALRVDFKAKDSGVNIERLAYSIHDQDVDKGYIKLAWAKKRIYLRFNLKVMDHAMANINAALEAAEPNKKWMTLTQGAQFLLEQDENLDLALEWSRQSTELKDHSWNWYVRAQIFAAKGKYKDAMDSVTKSRTLGAKEKDKYFKTNKEKILASVAEWKEKV
jgi:tetratricopeptide (TPR) repeat protein